MKKSKNKVLLVEDHATLAENTAELLCIGGFEVIGIMESGENISEIIQGDQPDVILLDIKLKGNVDGIQVGKLIREKFQIPIVYITSYVDKHIIDEIKGTFPDGYIIKPFTKETLLTSIEFAINNFQNKSNSGHLTEKAIFTEKKTRELFFRDKGWLRKIFIDDIDWVKTDGAYCHIYASSKSYTLRNTVKELMAKLPEDQFQRANKSYIINLNKIVAINSQEVVINEVSIPLGRGYYKTLVEVLNKISD